MTLRIGLIGAGGNTKLRHIPGFRAIDGVEITAVCNRSLASSRAVADEYGIAAVEEDWRALIDRDDVDAICIGTWPYTHAEMTIAALGKNKHVLTEARMALDVVEAREMLTAAQTSEARAMVVPAPFYLAFEQTLIDLVQDGVFGDLLEVHVNALGGGYNPSAPRSWRQRRDRSGNNIMSMGIFNETVRRYAGHEEAVMAYGKVFVAERDDPETEKREVVDIPDSLGILAEYESGATGVYHFSNVARRGRGAAFEFYGTRGGFRLENDQAFVSLDGGEFVPLDVAPEKRGGWRVEEEFVDAVRDASAITHTSFEDGVKYMQFTDAVQRSMAEARRVELREI